MVAFRLEFRTGSAEDPGGKEGLAALTAAMIGQGGTKELRYTEVLDLLYPMAAELGANADKEVTVVTGQVHKDHLESFYPLLRDLVVSPRFDPADFERLKADALNYLTNGLRGSDDEELGKWTLQTRLYAGHPYGHVDGGTVAGLNAITLDDVRWFWREHFTGDRLTIGIAGGYPAELPGRVAKDLKLLPDTGTRPSQVPAEKPLRGRHATLVEKEALATAVSWGFPVALTRRDDDFFALMIASSYLGEHRTFNGVLMNRLREVRGLNYGDYAYIENFIQDGGSTFPIPDIPRSRQYFSVWLRPVKPENAAFALRASLYHLERLVKEGIPEAGFRETRDFLLGYSRLWAQSTSRRLGYKLDSRWYGRKDFLAEIQERLPGITRAQVDTAIRKYLKSDGLEIAIVCSHATDLSRALTGSEPTPIHYDTEGTPAPVLAEDKVIAAYPLGLRPEDVTVVPVAETFEK